MAQAVDHVVMIGREVGITGNKSFPEGISAQFHHAAPEVHHKLLGFLYHTQLHHSLDGISSFCAGKLLFVGLLTPYDGHHQIVFTEVGVAIELLLGLGLCFLGGLMAVDIVPRKATGAALGVVGMASYVAAGIQDVVSGWLIDGNSTIIEKLDETTGQMVQATQYDFTPVAIFWIVASVISFILPVLNWKYRK